MLAIAELEELARVRLHEATALFVARQFDGSAYICGYAVELILKAKICATLRWDGYPESRKEFEHFSSFRIHDLHTLLSLTGSQEKIRTKYTSHWSNVSSWSPADRYRRAGSVSAGRARAMLASASFLVRSL